MHTNTRDLVSITDFARNPSSYVNNLTPEDRKVIIKNNTPVAVLISAGEIDRLEEVQDDIKLMTLALARKAADNGERYEAEDVFAELGLSLDDAEDD